MAKIEDSTQTQAQAATHSHPTAMTFVLIGVVLFAITGVEFAIISVAGMRATIVAVLFALSALKFFLVATYFMHLKWDSKVLAWVFAVGAVLATLITLAQRFVNMA